MINGIVFHTYDSLLQLFYCVNHFHLKWHYAGIFAQNESKVESGCVYSMLRLLYEL